MTEDPMDASPITADKILVPMDVMRYGYQLDGCRGCGAEVVRNHTVLDCLDVMSRGLDEVRRRFGDDDPHADKRGPEGPERPPQPDIKKLLRTLVDLLIPEGR